MTLENYDTEYLYMCRTRLVGIRNGISSCLHIYIFFDFEAPSDRTVRKIRTRAYCAAYRA